MLGVPVTTQWLDVLNTSGKRPCLSRDPACLSSARAPGSLCLRARPPSSPRQGHPSPHSGPSSRPPCSPTMSLRRKLFGEKICIAGMLGYTLIRISALVRDITPSQGSIQSRGWGRRGGGLGWISTEELRAWPTHTRVGDPPGSEGGLGILTVRLTDCQHTRFRCQPCTDWLRLSPKMCDFPEHQLSVREVGI